MQISPICVNLFSIQPKQQGTQSCATVPFAPKLKPLSVDTVSFTASAPNAGALRKLLAFGIPDLYSDVILFDPVQLQKILDKQVFSKDLKSIYKHLKKYRDSLFPIEENFFKMIKNAAKRNPKTRLEVFIQQLVPVHSQKLLNIQRPIFDELIRLSKYMPADILTEFDYLMYVTNKKLTKEPVYVPFSLKEFKYKLGRIKERIENSKNAEQKRDMRKIMNKISTIPEISKEKRLSSRFPIKKYEKLQVQMVLDLSNFIERTSLKSDKDLRALIDTSRSQVFKRPTSIKFNRKSFIHDLEEILDKLPDKKLARRMHKVAIGLPTSKDNISAFIMKSADRSAAQIGYDLFQGSLGTVDHLLAAHKGGSDSLENYALSSAFMNSQKAHQRFAVLLRNNPVIRIYCQNQIDRLIELANGGVFDYVGLSKQYIRSLAKRLVKLSPKEDPLILDTSALKYK